MNFQDYKFNIGDEVITTWGERGKIVDVCKCERCQDRGFYEPSWKSEEDDSVNFISIHAAENGFKNFYRIGKYRFGDFERENVQKRIDEHKRELEVFEKRLQVIDEVEIKADPVKRTAGEILSFIDEVCFSENYRDFRVYRGSRGQFESIMQHIRETYGVE